VINGDATGGDGEVNKVGGCRSQGVQLRRRASLVLNLWPSLVDLVDLVDGGSAVERLGNSANSVNALLVEPVIDLEMLTKVVAAVKSILPLMFVAKAAWESGHRWRHIGRGWTGGDCGADVAVQAVDPGE